MIKSKSVPHKDCVFRAEEPTSLEAIYILEYWCFIRDEEWGWDTYMVTEREHKAREAFEQVKVGHYYMRIRKATKMLDRGTIIAHYEHDGDGYHS